MLASITKAATDGLTGLLTRPEPEKKKEIIMLSETDFRDLEPVLALNDRLTTELQDDCSDEELKAYELVAPRVIVVGLTSAGKSSVMERIIGHRIFPTSASVCTRRPFSVHLKNDPSATGTVLKFKSGVSPGRLEREFHLPAQLEEVREIIASEQKSNTDTVEFDGREIHAEVRSRNSETFTFTDLPGIFMVSELKMAGDYARSREINERLRKSTFDIAKRYVSLPNTIVLYVLGATDWTHSMSNDPLVAALAEWLEEIRTKERREVPMYGVLTKLDMLQQPLSHDSPLKKVLTGRLGDDHILTGLRVRRWIPVVNNASVLNEPDPARAAVTELDFITGCLAKSSISSEAIGRMSIGRASLVRQLKMALLAAIGRTHGRMRARLDDLLADVHARLDRLPQPVTPHEKRRLFDSKLKLLEETLGELVGAKGGLKGEGKAGRSLRMQLMVDAPAQFEGDLAEAKLRGDVTEEVRHILDQAALEQGGSFDSDLSFNHLSQKIIDRFTVPCMKLVETSAGIIRAALKRAADKAFGDYRDLEALVLEELGLAAADEARTKEDLDRVFGFLRASAAGKVTALLQSYETMACYHPLWRNFDELYQNILRKDAAELKAKDDAAAEVTLQRILNLPALAQRAREEGELAIQTYERESRERISPANKLKIQKHFARVEVMGYIVRMSLTSSVFPLVLRDLRDGLFRGVKYGPMSFDHSVSSALRLKLMFDPAAEKRIFELMEPSAEDAAARARLTKKKETLLSLRTDFAETAGKLAKLSALLAQ